MNHVGRPEILLGNRFFPLTGTPISNNAFSKIKLDDWEPVPLAVATLITKSFTVGTMFGIHTFASACLAYKRPSLMSNELRHSCSTCQISKLPTPCKCTENHSFVDPASFQ